MRNLIHKPLFKIERKNNLISFIVFSLIVGALCFLTIALFPVLKDLLADLAKESAGTGLEDMFKMDNIADYFTSNMFQMWGLFGMIYAGVLAVRLTSNNFKDGSYELIYSLNISRTKIVITKLITLLIYLTTFSLTVAVFNYVGLIIFAGISGFSTLNFLLYALLTWVITLQVGIIAFALGLISKRKFGTVASIVLSLLFYIIITVSQASMVEWLNYLSPLSVIVTDVFTLGFAALKNQWITLLVWCVIPVTLLVLGVTKFKNDDLR